MCRLARGSHAFHREVKAWETLEKTRGVILGDDTHDTDTDKDKENTDDDDTEDTEDTEDADDNDDTDDNDDDIMMIFAKQH